MSNWQSSQTSISATLAVAFAGFLCAFNLGVIRAESLYPAGVGGVFQADMDGANVQTLAYGGIIDLTYTDVAVSASTGKVYFIRTRFQVSDVVMRHDALGVDSILVYARGARCLTVDGESGKLFIGLKDGSIQRCDLDGRNLTTVFAGDQNYGVTGIAADASKICWSEYNALTGESIVRGAELQYGYISNQVMIISGPGEVADVSVDTNAGKVYWVNPTARSVKRANWDGSGIETLADIGLTDPSSIAFARTGKVYWVDDSLTGGPSTIERANPDGSNRERVLVYQGISCLDIGPDGVVGVEKKTWGQIKQQYR